MRIAALLPATIVVSGLSKRSGTPSIGLYGFHMAIGTGMRCVNGVAEGLPRTTTAFRYNRLWPGTDKPAPIKPFYRHGASKTSLVPKMLLQQHSIDG